MNGRETYFTKDGTPFQVTPMVYFLPCRIPVVPGGDDAEGPLATRTAKCGHPAYCFIGTGAICRHHYEVFFRIAGATPHWYPPMCDE